MQSQENTNKRRGNASTNLTAYEQYRANNIERNQRRLLDLGLVDEDEANRVINSAWKKEKYMEKDVKTTVRAKAKVRRVQSQENSRKVSNHAIRVTKKTEGWFNSSKGPPKKQAVAKKRCGTGKSGKISKKGWERTGKWAIPRKEQRTVSV